MSTRWAVYQIFCIIWQNRAKLYFLSKLITDIPSLTTDKKKHITSSLIKHAPFIQPPLTLNEGKKTHKRIVLKHIVQWSNSESKKKRNDLAKNSLEKGENKRNHFHLMDSHWVSFQLCARCTICICCECICCCIYCMYLLYVLVALYCMYVLCVSVTCIGCTVCTVCSVCTRRSYALEENSIILSNLISMYHLCSACHEQSFQHVSLCW